MLTHSIVSGLFLACSLSSITFFSGALNKMVVHGTNRLWHSLLHFSMIQLLFKFVTLLNYMMNLVMLSMLMHLYGLVEIGGSFIDFYLQEYSSLPCALYGSVAVKLVLTALTG